MRFNHPSFFDSAANCETIGELAADFNLPGVEGEVSLDASTEADSFRITIVRLGEPPVVLASSKPLHVSYLKNPALRDHVARATMDFLIEAVSCQSVSDSAPASRTKLPPSRGR